MGHSESEAARDDKKVQATGPLAPNQTVHFVSLSESQP